MGIIQDIALKGGDIVAWLAAEGRVFYASDADQNDTVTGQTSFAATTPTFQLDVPSGTVAIPLYMSLNQTGTVAGGAIDVLMEYDDADRHSSGGTAETVLSNRTVGGQSNLATFRSNPTAAAGYGVRIMGLTIGQDVSTAEGAVNEVVWTPPGQQLIYISGAGAWNVYTYAETTGPTWFYTFGWAEVPEGWLQ